MESVLTSHIERTPGVCGGKACITGHRVRVSDIVVWHEKRGYCPEEIVALFPGISLSDVFAALTYYLDHQSEIEDELRQSDEWATWVAANSPSKIPVPFRN